MSERTRSTVRWLLLVGGLLAMAGVAVMIGAWPGSDTIYRIDGLGSSLNSSNSKSVAETTVVQTGSTVGAFTGGIVTGAGVVMVAVAGVAIGARTALAGWISNRV